MTDRYHVGDTQMKIFAPVLGSVVAILAFYILLSNGLWETWFVADRQGPQRPSTINNAVSSIDSNVMRIQSLLENLTYDEYPVEIADDLESIKRMESVIYKKLKEVSSHFRDDNTQYQKVLFLFGEWKSIRDQAIELTASGSSQRAKDIVRIDSAAHAYKIRAALISLNIFSERRADDFDSAAAKKHPGEAWQ